MMSEINGKLVQASVEHLHHMDACRVTIQFDIDGLALADAELSIAELDHAFQAMLSSAQTNNEPNIRIVSTSKGLELSGDFGSW